MKVQKLILPVLLGTVLLSGTAFAQVNIDTQSSSSSLGSTSFGYLPSGADLQIFMQATVAPTCVGPGSVQTCTSAGTNGVVGGAGGDRDNFSRISQMPGSFTDSAFGVISSDPNFACGPVASSGGCGTQLIIRSIGNRGAIGTVPLFFDNTNFHPGINNAAADRDFVGAIRSNIVVGDGGVTAGMPDGFVNFVGTRAVFGCFPSEFCVQLDQSIDQTIDLGGGNLMSVSTRARTMVQSISAPQSPPSPGFVSSPSGSIFTSFGAGAGFLETSLDITQAPADGFGALNLSMQSNFFGVGNFNGPQAMMFVTPGLETGIDASAEGFSPEFSNVGFP